MRPAASFQPLVSTSAVQLTPSGTPLKSKYLAFRPENVGRALRIVKVLELDDGPSSGNRASSCAVKPRTSRLSPFGDCSMNPSCQPAVIGGAGGAADCCAPADAA